MSRYGFTLIELLTVVAIIGLMATVTLMLFFGKRNSADITSTQTQMAALLRQSENRAVSQYQDVPWGVRFSTSSTVPFYAAFSSAYSTATVIASYRLPPSVGLELVPSGLIGHWTFDEGSGSNVRDYSGNGNNGVWSGNKTGTSGYYSAGKVGPWAGVFDGSTDAVSLATSTAFPSGNSARTLSVWLRRTADTGSGLYEIAGYGTSNDNAQFYILMVGSSTYASQPAHSIIVDDDYGTTGWFATGYVISDTNWHHVVAVADGSNNTYVYVDGVLVGSGLHTWATVVSNAYIGKSSSGYLFPGMVDDVRLYNRALSLVEITQLYNGSTDVLFSPITGSISASTSIRLYSLSQPNFSSTISIGGTGAVSF